MTGGITYLNGIKQSDDSINQSLFTLGYIDKNKKTAQEKLELILCKPDGTELVVLYEAFNISTSMVFKDMDSIVFNIPYYLSQQYQQIKNPNWDLIKDGYLVKVNNQKMFIITEVEEYGDDKDIKTVTCSSREWLLGKRMLRNFQGTRQLYKSAGDGTIARISYSLDGVNYVDYTDPFETEDNKDIGVKIYDSTNTLISFCVWNNNKLLQVPDVLITYEATDVVNKKIQVTMKIIAETGEGIMNLLEQQTSWKVGFIDNAIREDSSTGQDHRVYRTFSVSEKSWLAFIKEDIQQSFNCVVTFDTVNKLINFYSIDTLTSNKGLYISEENYLKSIKKHTKDDEIVTRLSIYGKDNLTIASVNPTGKVYVENFIRYRTLDYMPQDLLDALDNYDTLIANNTPIFYNLLQQQNNLFNMSIQLNNQLVDLQFQLTRAQDAIDAAIQASPQGNETTPTVVTGTGQQGFDVTAELTVNFDDIQPTDLTSLNDAKAQIQAQIDTKNQEITNNTNALNSKNQEIQDLANILAKENNFTHQQLELLDEFVKEKTWSNENYTDPRDLMAAGESALDKISQPIIEFDIELVDLLNIVECQHDWDKLNIGDIINVDYSKFNVSIELRIMKIEHKIDDNTLSITVSNKDETDNTQKYLSDIMSMTQQTAATLDIFKHEWDLSSSNQDLISNIMNNALDSAKNRVLGGRKQNTSIDERGIILKDMDSDQEQLRMLNNVIAFTQDGWQSCSLAITPKGIVGQEIYGKIIGSNKLVITNMNDQGESSFLVDGEHMKAINMDLSLENKTHLNRLYLNPDVGIKIQKRPTIGDEWKDALYLDNSGEIWAKAFHVINTNSILDDTGLKIFNGNITVYNGADANSDIVFNVNNNGESDAFGRFRVFRYSGTSKVTLADMYKDDSKGGKIMLNDWNGNINAFLGSAPDTSYTGGFLKLYNGSTSKERVEIGTYASNDMGVINIKNNNSKPIVEINGNNNGGTINLKNANQKTQIHISSMDDTGVNQGIIQLYGEDNNIKLTLKAKSDNDNMSELVSGDRKTGGFIQLASYDNSTNGFITINNENNFGMYDDRDSAFEINNHIDAVIINHRNKSNISLSNGGAHFLLDNRSKFKITQGVVGDNGTIQNAIDFNIPCIAAYGNASFSGMLGEVINLGKDLGNTNYVVSITPNSNSGGYIGEYWYIKNTNGFTVYNSGCATSGFDYIVLAY
ncbi:phage tail protein [Clostridium sp. DJ247]|uniref:phage tail protein n=1 Tax=Clostridium sp. DJ247 TaxID=2726188 RepID=UPI0016259E93|nr:phage tail protein [Clostridium sp. DJ247]MBC2580837.1 hypothetical protein [Clostridium sp. DJ247]